MRLPFYCIIFFAVVNGQIALAQNGSVTQDTQDRALMSNLSLPTLVVGSKGRTASVIGTAYLDTTWQVGTVTFYRPLSPASTVDSLANVSVRLDLITHDIEVQAGSNDIRLAKGTDVRSVRLKNTDAGPYVNVRNYQGEADALAGFFEQVASGKLSLLQYSSVYVVKANYNSAMGTGSKDDERVRKEDWYTAQNGQVTKFSAGKKALLALMTDKKEQIEAFLKTQKPDLKAKAGLKAAFAYYNTL